MGIKQERNVGIDLLRIVSMMMVVVLHVLWQGGILYSANSIFVNHSIVWFLEIAAYCSVNCYALVSGYVGINSKRKASGLMTTWLQVAFYSVTITVIFYFANGTVGISDILKSFFPVINKQYWYFTAYFGMWFFIPLMNAAINHLPKKQAAVALISAGIFLIPIEIWRGVFHMNFGYSVIWLSYLYLIGAYIAKHKTFAGVTLRKPLLVYFACVLTTFIFKIVMGFLDRSGELLISYLSPFMLIAAIALLVMFSNLKISSRLAKIICVIAPLSFGVYLIHTHTLVFTYIIEGLFKFLALKNPFVLFGGIIIGVVVIFVVCILIEYIRSWLFKILRIQKLFSYIEDRVSKLFERWFGRFFSTNE